MKKRIVSIILSLVMLLSLLPTAAFATEVTGLEGSGTEADPYLIGTLAELKFLAGKVNTAVSTYSDSSRYYRLTADIDGLTTTIGIESYNFLGHFDGAGHTVTLNMEGQASTPFVGMFGIIGGNGEVSNVNTAGTVKGLNNVGGICGDNYGTILNCVNRAAVYSANDDAGGICGCNDGVIDACVNYGNVSADSAAYVGGINGKGVSGAVARNCVNYGNISSNEKSGGIVGNCLGESIINCANYGTVSGNIDSGGIAGSSAKGTVKNAVCGGEFGSTGSNYGISSYNNKGTIKNSYYDKEATNAPVNAVNSSSAGSQTNVAGLTTAQMKAESGDDALITKLNGYRESDSYPSGWLKWYKEEGKYPTLPCHVNVISSANGSVTVGNATPPAYNVADYFAKGDQVTLTVAPADGYALKADSLKVNSGNGTVSVSGSGSTYTFEMPDCPVTVTAEFEEGTTPSGETHTHDVGDAKNVVFTAWTDALAETQNGSGMTAANSLPGTAGNYYLTADITLKNWTVPSGTTTLCLNGYEIDFTSSGIKAGDTGNAENVTLNLCDCDTTKEHYFKDYKIDTYYGSDYNYYSWVPATNKDEATHTVKGGVITSYNSVVSVHMSSTFNMYGGTLTGSCDRKACAVPVDRGSTFNMYGGAICGTYNDGSGGAVYLGSSGDDTGNDTWKNNAFNMYGGLITDNGARQGGAIYVYCGNCNIAGGTIENNTATQFGGAIYDDNRLVDGVTSVSGTALIRGNMALTEGGGGVYFGYNGSQTGVFHMTGGKITGNNAKYGGGIWCLPETGKKQMFFGGTAKVTGNVIGGTKAAGESVYTGGTADNLRVGSNRMFYFGDGTTVAAPAQGMELGVKSNDTVYSYKPVAIAGTENSGYGDYLIPDDETQEVFYDDTNKTLGLKTATTYSVSCSGITNGKVEANKTSAKAGATVTLTVTPSEGYQLKAGSLQATYNTSQTCELTQDENDKTKYTFKMPAYDVTVTAEFESSIVPHTHKIDGDDVEFTPWGDKTGETTSLPTTSGNYYLTKDVKLSSQYQVKSTGDVVMVNLCLNGHVVDCNGKDFFVGANPNDYNSKVSLTIDDCDTTTSHKGYLAANGYWVHDEAGTHVPNTANGEKSYDPIIGGVITNSRGIGIFAELNLNGGTIAGFDSPSSYGSIVLYDNSRFIMNGGALIANRSQTGVYVYYPSCEFDMKGGIIRDNTSTDKGGGVYVYKGVFNMTGGEISRNHAPNGGGGVYIGSQADAKVSLTGGKIYDNTATNAGGGVFTWGTKEGSFMLGGSVKIYGNKVKEGEADSDSDVKENNGRPTIGLVDGNRAGMYVGIDCTSTGAFTTTSNATEDDAKHFFSNNAGYYISCSDSESNLWVSEITSGNYKVNVTPAENGVVYAPQYAAANTEVTLTAVPDDGYELDHFTVTDADGGSVEVKDNKFTMPAKAVTVKASFQKAAPSIKVVKAKDGDNEVANPVYGTAKENYQLFDVNVLNFPEGTTPTLTLQWQKVNGQAVTWDGTAPTGVTLNKDTGAVTTTNQTPAGSYIFRITNSANEFIEEEPNPDFVCGEGTLTVDKATPTITTAPTASAIVYGKAVSASQLTGGAATPSGGTFAWESTDAAVAPTVAQSGTAYTVVYTPTNTTNYNTATVEVAVTVNKYTPSITAWPTLPTTITYGDFETFGDITLTGGTEKESIAGTFGWADSFKNTEATVANGGTKTDPFVFTPTDTDNYNTVTGGGSVAVTINAANYADTYSREASGNLKAKLDETVEITLPTIPDGASYGTVTNENTGLFTVGTIDETTGEVIVTSAKEWDKETDGTDAKTFTVAVTPDGNHNSYEITVSITPTYKTVVTVTATKQDFTYGDANKTGYTGASAKVNSEEVSGLAATLVATYYKETATAGTYETTGSTNVPTDAGNYQVVLSVPGTDENYEGASEPIAFTIAKAGVEKPKLSDAVTIGYANEKIAPKDGYEVSTTSGDDFATGKLTGETAIDFTKTYYVRKVEDANHNASAQETFVPVRPTTPGTPKLVSKTDTTVVVTAVTGQEYSLNGTAWQDSNEFNELTAGKEYSFYQRVKATASSFKSESSAALSVTTKTAPASAPSVTAANATITENTVTLPYDATYEYQMDSGKWQGGEGKNIFTGLYPATQHTFKVRVKETETAMPSNEATITVYTAAETPANVAATGTVSYSEETFELNSGFEISETDAPSFSAMQPTDRKVALQPNKTYYIRKAATSTPAVPASATVSLTIPARPSTPSAPELVSKTDTTVVVTAVTGQEYSKDNGTTWQDSGEFTVLTANTQYNIITRVKATSTSFKSENSNALTVTTKMATPLDPKSLIDFTPNTNLVYSRTAKTAVVAAKSGVEGLGNITVTYEKDGTEASPVDVGTYKVYATIAVGSNYNAIDKFEVGEFTITAKPITLTWSEITTVVYNGTEQTIEATIPNGAVVNGDTVNVSTSKVTKAGDAQAITASLDNDNYTIANPTKALTVTPKVTISKKGDSKFEPIEAISTTNTGSYALPDGTELAPGIYQVVTETGDKTVTTILNVVKDEEPALSVTIPTKATSSVVEIVPATEGSKVTTPDVTVGGLEAVADEAAEDGKSVVVKLIVEAKEVVTDKDNPDAEQEAIKAENDVKGKTVEFLDVQIKKFEDGNETGNITDTEGNLIEIVVPFQTSGRTGFKVVRYHDSAAQVLTELKDGDTATEGSFRVDTKASTITIYASKFSTYAVAYSNVSSGGGSVSNSITLPASVEHGKVNADKEKASSGETVTITVTPDKGFTLETLTVLDKNGKEVEVKNLGNNKYSFKMPTGKVSISATFMEDNSMLNFFVDVKATDYYYDAVLWAAENDITKGTDAVHFSPDMGTTRAQVVTFLWRTAGCPEPKGDASKFVDVPANEYYAKAVAWAIEQVITKGTSATTFTPDAVCTRGQIVTFLARFAGVADEATGYTHGFTDVKSTDYFNNAVAWAKDNKVTEGTSATTFSPNDDCTRAQVVTFLYRWMVK